MKKTTQKLAILNYLKTHKKGITSKEAFEKFGATRLSGIIFVLTHKNGYKINAVYESVPTRYGRSARIARYILEG